MRTLTKLSIAVSSALLSVSTFAGEQPVAADLVGKTYGGLHALHIKIDDDRQFTADPASDLDHASGVGAELGYRFSETTEFRIAYSHMNLVADLSAYSGPSGSSTALDMLYFPNKENFYLLAGANRLDIVDAKLSSNLGAGYRYYLNEKSAVYLEGKWHKQFDDHYDDFTTQLGFVYFFGDSAKKAPVAAKPVQPAKAAAPVAVAAAPVVKDSDKDGIIDSKDNCRNTPMSDKVDANGCTVFTEKNLEMSLQVNFDNNKSEVKPQYFDDIKVAADFLKQYPHTDLIIKGHTSAQGSAAYNKSLSQKRADAIVAILIEEFGIASNRLTAQGLGEEQLLDQSNTAAAHAQNRRIEAKVVVKEKVAVKR
ncbi:OmpA family protein [Thalassotalea sp. PLHSN55]|uniref:OmpA family protein n=1 Tax=Thalassotalea sp. PLHSN55 TaxID=3435888 RepID=UPI003F875A2B